MAGERLRTCELLHPTARPTLQNACPDGNMQHPMCSDVARAGRSRSYEPHCVADALRGRESAARGSTSQSLRRCELGAAGARPIASRRQYVGLVRALRTS